MTDMDMQIVVPVATRCNAIYVPELPRGLAEAEVQLRSHLYSASSPALNCFPPSSSSLSESPVQESQRKLT